MHIYNTHFLVYNNSILKSYYICFITKNTAQYYVPIKKYINRNSDQRMIMEMYKGHNTSCTHTFISSSLIHSKTGGFYTAVNVCPQLL